MALELMLSQRMSVAQVARTLGSSVSKATLYSLRRSFLKTSRAERKRKGAVRPSTQYGTLRYCVPSRTNITTGPTHSCATSGGYGQAKRPCD